MQIPWLFKYPENFTHKAAVDIAIEMKQEENVLRPKVAKKKMLFQYTHYDKQQPLGITNQEMRTLFKVLLIAYSYRY